MIRFLVRVTVLIGVLAAVAVGATSSQEASILPSVEAPATPATSTPSAGAATPEPVQLEISVLRAGPGPYAWSVSGRIASTFVTDSPKTLRVVAMAQFAGRQSGVDRELARELDAQIAWEIVPPEGFAVMGPVRPRGARLDLTLTRPKGNPTGVGAPLAVTVRAFVQDGKRQVMRQATLRQDLRDRLRQEYIDLERAYVPSRSDLLSEEQFKQQFGERYPAITFEALNATRQPGQAERYPFILARPELVRTLHQVQEAYGQKLIISSGYRNPVRQNVVHGSVEESFHQYGRAADLYVMPDSAPPKTGRLIAIERDWLRLAAAAIRGGGAWVEPMLACNVNTDGCHVHVDVREAGARSRIVQVRGRVTDPAGNPVANAQVRLAGMPAVANDKGEFHLKHVLTPGAYELEAMEDGRGSVTRQVQIAGDLAQAALVLPIDPRPSFIARFAHGWVDVEKGGMARVTARLKNVGASAAQNLRVSPMVNAASPRVGPPPVGESVSVAQLKPGAEVDVVLNVPLPAGVKAGQDESLTLPLTLIATSRRAGGEVRTQRLSLAASLQAESPRQPDLADGIRAADMVDLKQPPAARDVAGGAGGLLLGGAAAALSARAARKNKARTTPKEPETEASVLPSSPLEEQGK